MNTSRQNVVGRLQVHAAPRSRVTLFETQPALLEGGVIVERYTTKHGVVFEKHYIPGGPVQWYKETLVPETEANQMDYNLTAPPMGAYVVVTGGPIQVNIHRTETGFDVRMRDAGFAEETIESGIQSFPVALARAQEWLKARYNLS
jgi:hypothetical protein